jgi:plastocyanin
MNRRQIIIFVAIIAVLVAIGAVVIANRQPTPEASPSPSPTPTAAAQTSPSTSASPASLTMVYTASGFSPQTITLTSGKTLTFKNDTSETIQVDSNPHPQHTDNPELNAGTIMPGESKTVTLTKAGTWKIHNHLDSTDQATVIVQ